jgi:curved DNA-binding protein CbpA
MIPTSPHVFMECNKDEAARMKALAERKMLDNDFVGAKEVIIKVQQLSEEVDDIDIPKMLTVCDVHCAAGGKVNAEIDCYGILQVPVTADDELIKKQYRKLALLLHPDKNKFGGAEAAFKLVREANITLTDRSMRFMYDVKRKASAARPPYQEPRRHTHARSRDSPVNLHERQQPEHQASNPSGTQETFWTICPSCSVRYKYYISILKKTLRCQNCQKKFTAHKLKEQDAPSGANQRTARVRKNAGAQQKFPSTQTIVTGPKPWSATLGVHVDTGSHHDGLNTKRETDGNTAGFKDKMKSDRATGNAPKVSSTAGLKSGRRGVIESSISETSEEEIFEHGPAANSAVAGQQTRRSSRHKQEAKCNEDGDDSEVEDDDNNVDDDFVNSPGLKRLRKSGLFHNDHSHSNKTINLNEDITSNNGPTNCVNNCSNSCAAGITDVDAKNICQTEYARADSEFYDFSQKRLLQNFSCGQIWALYSNVDKFPNYYGIIQKVDLKNDTVQVRWLDVCPQEEEELRLLLEERPIGCGTFRLSSTHELTTMTYTGTDAFSQLVEARSTGKKGEYEIIPHLGEIWAIFKNWRAGWTAKDFKKCEYELVEILGHTDSSIQTRVLRKVDGYRTIFMPCRAEGSLKTIRKDEYPKFSHQIPCFHLTHEKGGNLRGYLELDPLSLPEEFLNVTYPHLP